MIIGITGHKRSGKSLLAQYIASEYGFTVRAFADPIKEAVRAIFGWTTEHTDGALKEIIDPRWGISPRQVMQHIGTEWGRTALPGAYHEFQQLTDRELWVNRFLFWWQDEGRPNVVVPDVRFQNESEIIRNHGGIVVKITRVGCYGDNHPSETSIDKLNPDWFVKNNGSESDLLSVAYNIMSDCGFASVEQVR